MSGDRPEIDDHVLAQVLDDLDDRLGRAGIAWCLGGSGSRRVRGAAVVPADVDIVVAVDARPALAVALGPLTGAAGPRPTAWRSAWLARWRHPGGVMVECIGGAAVEVDGRREDLPPSRAVVVAWRGRDVPVSAPDVWDRLATA